MENKQDARRILEYLYEIRDNNINSLETIDSINLLMVDGNNGRVKDAQVAARIKELEDRLGEVSAAVSKVEGLLGGNSC